MPVYFIQRGDDGPIKIGHAKDIGSRLSTLQTGQPDRLHLRHIFVGGAQEEAALHARFAAHRLAGEWFSPVPEIVSGDAGLEVFVRPKKKRSAGPTSWSEATYRAFMEKTEARMNDPAFIARRAESIAVRSAVTALRSGSDNLLCHLRRISSPNPVVRLRARNHAKAELARLEKAQRAMPGIIEALRRRADEGNDPVAITALKSWHALASVVQAWPHAPSAPAA